MKRSHFDSRSEDPMRFPPYDHRASSKRGHYEDRTSIHRQRSPRNYQSDPRSYHSPQAYRPEASSYRSDSHLRRESSLTHRSKAPPYRQEPSRHDPQSYRQGSQPHYSDHLIQWDRCGRDPDFRKRLASSKEYNTVRDQSLYIPRSQSRVVPISAPPHTSQYPRACHRGRSDPRIRSERYSDGDQRPGRDLRPDYTNGADYVRQKEKIYAIQSTRNMDFSDSSYSSEEDDDDEDVRVGNKESKKPPKTSRPGYDSEGERFDPFPFGVPDEPLQQMFSGRKRGSGRNRGRGLGGGRGNRNYSGRSNDAGDDRAWRDRSREDKPGPRSRDKDIQIEPEEEIDSEDSEPESLPDDDRQVDDDNVDQPWVLTRMFLMIKTTNYLKKRRTKDEQSLTKKQLAQLDLCEEDIEDIWVRTEEKFEKYSKQIAAVKEEMFNSVHPPNIKQRKLDDLTRDANETQKRLNQWKDWMENGTKPKSSKKVTKAKQMKKVIPVKGRNIFVEDDDKEASDQSKSGAVFNTTQEAKVKASNNTQQGVPDKDLIKYPTVVYPTDSIVQYPVPGAIPLVHYNAAPSTDERPDPRNKEALNDYIMNFGNTTKNKPLENKTEEGMRDPISEMFDL